MLESSGVNLFRPEEIEGLLLGPVPQSKVSAAVVVNPNDTSVQCKVCMFVLSDADELKSHMSICTGKRNSMCNLCGRIYSSRCALKEHLRGQHNVGKQFACQKCGKVLKTNTRLYDHSCSY